MIALMLGISALVSFKEIKTTANDKKSAKKETKVIEQVVYSQSNSPIQLLSPIGPANTWGDATFYFSAFELNHPFQLYLQKKAFKIFTLNFFKRLTTHIMSPQAP
jgi:hypothetical protein